MAHEDVQAFLATRRDQRKEVARIEALSDAVFAIAMTLLVLQLEVPSTTVDLWAAVRGLWPNFLSFAISFAVIGGYWVAHHRLFALVERSTPRLLWLNLCALFFIVLLPFTTSLIGNHGAGPHGDYALALSLYALSIAGAGILLSVTAAYALTGHRLCAPEVPQALIRYSIWRGLALALTFVLSLALLPLGPAAVEFSWLSLFVTQRILRRRMIGSARV